MTGSPSLHSPDPHLLELVDVPGKGKGLVAKIDIPPGTQLVDEAPLFTTASLTNAATIEKDLAKLVRALPKDGQRAFLSLHNNNPGPNPFSNIVRSNGYPLGPNSETGGIFPVISRFNHSCRPNAQHAWNPARQRELVHAIRPIRKGDEVTLSYSYGGASAERRRDLSAYFGFGCACELCGLPAEQLAASDARWRRAAKLDGLIGDPKRVRQNPEAALADCRALRAVYVDEEVVDLRLARLYWDAFQICAMHADAVRAREFVRRYHEAKSLCEGEDHAEAKTLGSLMDRPTDYGDFGVTKQWLSQKNEVPKDLSSDAFERWLWKE